MKLSICVVTMNRADQLKEALESCLACNLPDDTEFVIVDNASSDETEKTVNETLEDSVFCYTKMEKNMGCGGGRNYAYNMCRGEYVYVLDDDAVISQTDFFTKAISVLDTYSNIITLTSQIYDSAWKKNRVQAIGSPFESGLYYCKIFCGGSHFIRKSFFPSAPYLNNMYGYEEILPSMQVWDSGKINAFMPEIQINHNPRRDKWNHSDVRNDQIIVNECAVRYAINKSVFPYFFLPLNYLVYLVRCKKYLSSIKGWKINAKDIVEKTISICPSFQMKFRTAWKLLKRFGIGLF